jgi:RNA polymerase sigma factor (sigma-70 family)
LPGSRKLLSAFSNDRLVELVRRGSDTAFEVLYDRHSRGVLTFCRHMLSSQEEAEDAVQHTFISAYASIRGGGEREIKVKPWLYTIARNRCLSVLRARREQAAEIADLPTAGLGEAVQHRADLRELLVDIRQLPEDQRAALVLSEVGDLSHGEIAQIVGCEATKVKSLVFQARTSLIESRKAREIPCHEIRDQLANGQGGELRRGPLRKHVKQCVGCSEFRAEVRAQRKLLAAALPVIPTVGLKHSALGAVGISGSASAAGSGAAAGGLASIAGTSGAAKAIALVACAGVAVSGGVAINDYRVATHDSSSAGQSGSAAAGTAAQRTGAKDGLAALLAPEAVLRDVAGTHAHGGKGAAAADLPSSGDGATREHGGAKTDVVPGIVKHGGPVIGHGHFGTNSGGDTAPDSATPGDNGSGNGSADANGNQNDNGNAYGQAQSDGPGVAGGPAADAPGQASGPGDPAAGNAGGNSGSNNAGGNPDNANVGTNQGTKEGRLGSNGTGNGNGPITRGNQLGHALGATKTAKPDKAAQDTAVADTAAAAEAATP